ncbi:MAG TPA: hypothetical protein VF656_17630 [Pyrinomonadaceae bacterium]|jgi:hypothetical protein
MKRILGALSLSLVLLAASSLPTLAQTYRGGRYAGRTATGQTYRRYDRRYNERYNDRSVWERSRDKITVAGAAGAGALIGGLAGGKKGALVGALIGAGGSALYTYKLRDRNNRRYRR